MNSWCHKVITRFSILFSKKNRRSVHASFLTGSFKLNPKVTLTGLEEDRREAKPTGQQDRREERKSGEHGGSRGHEGRSSAIGDEGQGRLHLHWAPAGVRGGSPQPCQRTRHCWRRAGWRWRGGGPCHRSDPSAARQTHRQRQLVGAGIRAAKRPACLPGAASHVLLSTKPTHAVKNEVWGLSRGADIHPVGD